LHLKGLIFRNAEHQVRVVCRVLAAVKAVGVLAVFACRKGSCILLAPHKRECSRLLPIVLLGARLFLAVARPDALEKWKKSCINSLVAGHEIN